MLKLLFSVLLLLNVSFSIAQSTWTADTSQAAIGFTATHLGISEVMGNFTKFNGVMKSSNPDFTDAQITFSVAVNSLNTDNNLRDDHLKSADFFNADKYPEMTFKSSSFKKISDKKYVLTGNLTIKDVTRQVSFDVIYGGTAIDDKKKMKAGFKATTTINRFDYHLNWNKFTEAVAVVNTDVAIIISLEFTEQK